MSATCPPAGRSKAPTPTEQAVGPRINAENGLIALPRSIISAGARGLGRSAAEFVVDSQVHRLDIAIATRECISDEEGCSSRNSKGSAVQAHIIVLKSHRPIAPEGPLAAETCGPAIIVAAGSGIRLTPSCWAVAPVRVSSWPWHSQDTAQSETFNAGAG
jgi:hypothetical protein